MDNSKGTVVDESLFDEQDATARKARVTVSQWESPHGQTVVFVPADWIGSRDSELINLLDQLRGAGPIPDEKELNEGYFIRQLSRSILVYVVGVGPEPGQSHLSTNLGAAIEALLSDENLAVQARADEATWWMPLLGEGSDGGLTLDNSARIIGQVLAMHRSKIWGNAWDDLWLTVNLPRKAPLSALSLVRGALEEGFGENVAVNSFGPDRSGEPNETGGTELIVAIQQAVNELSNPGEQLVADGVAGPQLQVAVEEAAATNGFEWTGEFDSNLLLELRQAGRRRERARFHADRPVADGAADALSRKAVAQAIAQNITHVWPDHAKNKWPFIVHLSGEWGSGKSSVLQLLREVLMADESQTKNPDRHPQGHRGWVVAEFNAWRMQGQGMAWWTLLNVLLSDATKQSRGKERLRLTLSDSLWRFQIGWRPWIIGGLAVATVILTWVAFAGTNQGGPFDGLVKLSPFLTAALALVSFVTTFTARSKRTAEAMLELDLDPLKPLRERYKQMVEQIGRPVAVFVDDLDRCDAEYVIEVLQALQTVYSEVPVLYVVAADRQWIVSAYEQKYSAFSESLSRPGQPLGHRFLNKIFQLSVAIPDLTGTDRGRYLQLLVEIGEREAKADPAEERMLLDGVATAGSDDEIIEAVAAAHGTASGEAVAREGFKRLMERDVQASIRHRLLDYVDLLDANPRGIKRLVNAYSFRLAYALQSQAKVKPDVLVRWCILDLRFPHTASLLRDDPTLWEIRERGETENVSFEDPLIGKILNPLSAEDIREVIALG